VAFFFLPIKLKKGMLIATQTFFLLLVTLIITLNLIDVPYFNYINKRSTFELFTILTGGDDFKQQLPTFLRDFWYLFIVLLVLILVVYFINVKLFKKSKKYESASFRIFTVQNCAIYVLLIGTLIFVGRGGFVMKPVGPLDVNRFVLPSKNAFVLNTPFTMLRSIGGYTVKEIHYYSSIEETEKYFSPHKTSNPQHLLPDRTNVVVLILESFGQEFVGFYNQGKTYTPFLDSLLSESLTFSASMANGKQSIESIPSIMVSIPSLQDKAYIASKYLDNRVIGLPELLKKYGYYSAFFYGATEGSMRFDSFTKAIGFDRYVGRRDYNNEKHADPTWGILDEYFEPWTAKQISTLKQPFLATMFSLSSHHPYYIPPHRQKDVIQGEQAIATSISYGDLSLRLFFEEAKKQPWYDNTLFVLCADHTPGTSTPSYNLTTQLYKIPIAYYHPGGFLPKERQQKITQQIDIYPTILDLLNIKTNFYSFGASIYEEKPRWALNYLEGSYLYFVDTNMLVYSQDRSQHLYDYTVNSDKLSDILEDHRQEIDLYEKRLRAIIQRYNHDLIYNRMHYTVNESKPK